jgi:hypothetical protein
MNLPSDKEGMNGITSARKTEIRWMLIMAGTLVQITDENWLARGQDETNL